MSEDAPATPAEAVLLALHARDRLRYEHVVSLVDARSLVERFRGYCEVTQPHTLERFAEEYPAVPPEDRPRRFEAYCRALGDPMKGVAELFPEVRSHADLEALDPRVYLCRFLESFDDRIKLAGRLRERGRPVPPSLTDLSRSRRYEVLDTAPEAPDLAHVTYRMVTSVEGGPDHHGEEQRLSTRRQADGSWRLLVPNVYFLAPFGNSVTLITEEYADLFEDEIRDALRRAGRERES